MALLNYTTTVPAEKTLGEIQSILAKAGARSITVQYDPAGVVQGLSFSVVFRGTSVTFLLPCRTEGISKILTKSKAPPRYQRPEHLLAISLRIMKDWLEAQLAMLQSEQAELPELFLGYAKTAGGESFYVKIINEGDTKLLTY